MTARQSVFFGYTNFTSACLSSKKFLETAAKHFEKASEHHRSAAQHAADGDLESAAQQAHVAHGAFQAHEHAALAIKKNVALHEQHEEEEVE